MKIFVISLSQACERRVCLSRQFTRAQMNFEFFNAINGVDGRAIFDRISYKKYLLNTGRAPSDGEIGCYASHFYLWNLCVVLGHPIVVLEDDAELSPFFGESLAVVENWISRFGFIRLQADHPNQRAGRLPVAKDGQFRLEYCRRYPFSAMGYAISPGVASSFTKSSASLAGPVDWFIKQTWLHRQPLYVLSPACIYGGKLRLKSSIHGRDQKTRRVGIRALRALAKLRSAVGRSTFNFQQLRRLGL